MSHEPKRSEDSPPKSRQNSGQITPFESIRRTNPTGNEFWSSRDFAKVLGYADYRNFQSVIESARTACFNSGQRVEDHFVEVTDMIEVGKGARRPAKSMMYRGVYDNLEAGTEAVFPFFDRMTGTTGFTGAVSETGGLDKMSLQLSAPKTNRALD